MSGTVGALSLLAVSVVAAAFAGTPRRPWPIACAVAMLTGAVLMLRSPTAGTLGLLAAGFLAVTAVETVRLARAMRPSGGGAWHEPLVGWGCAGGMLVMAMAMHPMPGMAHDGLAAGLAPTALAAVSTLVGVGGVAAVARLGRPVADAGAVGGRLRHHACSVAHLAMCAGMGLPLVLAL